jgi:hypothetical protein
MSINGPMHPGHPRWEEFKKRLEGPEACHFRYETPGDSTTFRFNCKGGTNTDFAEKILADMGATPEEVRGSLKLFAARGGFCDCEILFNVEPRKLLRRDRHRPIKGPKFLN